MLTDDKEFLYQADYLESIMRYNAATKTESVFVNRSAFVSMPINSSASLERHSGLTKNCNSLKITA